MHYLLKRVTLLSILILLPFQLWADMSFGVIGNPDRWQKQ